MDALKTWARYGAAPGGDAAREFYRRRVNGPASHLLALVLACDFAASEMRAYADEVTRTQRERRDNRADGRGWTKRKIASERKLWRQHIKKTKREQRLCLTTLPEFTT